MLPIQLPPGVVAKPTPAENSAFWREVNLVRWDNDVMLPVGGWANSGLTGPTYNIRAIHSWVTADGNEWTAYLTEGELFVEIAGELYDVSPTPPIALPSTGGGYSAGPYNASSYGSPRVGGTTNLKPIGTAFTLDNWGDNLMAMSSADGRLLEWVPDILSPDPAEVVANAPINNRSFTVTPERHIILFQYNSTRGVAWCGQEDNTDWDFADVTSKAGTLPVEPAAPFVASASTGTGSVFSTTKKTYIVRPVGLPFVYSVEELVDGATPISHASLKAVDDGAIWPSDSGFWMFDGASVSPLICQVWPWIIKQIDWRTARTLAVSVNLVGTSEYWWFFPTAGSNKNNRYVIYNYRTGIWSMGILSRSAGYSSSYNSNPIMADNLDIYVHENGLAYPGAEQLPWAETFTINAQEGKLIATINQLMPEVEGNIDNLRFSLLGKYERSTTQFQSPLRAVQANGLVDMLVSGRDLRLRVESVAGGAAPWTLGNSLMDIVANGRRRL